MQLLHRFMINNVSQRGRFFTSHFGDTVLQSLVWSSGLVSYLRISGGPISQNKKARFYALGSTQLPLSSSNLKRESSPTCADLSDTAIAYLFKSINEAAPYSWSAKVSQLRLRWQQQHSISKVPQSVVHYGTRTAPLRFRCCSIYAITPRPSPWVLTLSYPLTAMESQMVFWSHEKRRYCLR